MEYTFNTEILSSLYERPWAYWEQSWTSATSMQANSSSHRKSDTFDTFDEIWDEAEDITDSCLHLDDTNSNYFLTFNLDHVRTEDTSSNIRWARISAANLSIGSTTGCTITEKAPTRAFSWLKAPTSTFTFKTLLRHYANWALTPR